MIGSSPLTRGTQLAIRQRERGRRFIPAYAGNSRVRESLLFDSAVHPRLRGELKVKVKKVFILLGSSPLTRGTHQSIDEVRVNARFIPAYAGNSETSALLAVVHNGSSPLTRGTLLHLLIVHEIARFIPAYAGNSPNIQGLRIGRPVHPRLRGELYRLSKKRFSRHGSSPLTRGTRCDRHQRFNVCRFIPAYAGNSKQQKSEQNATTVHPRLRGELIAVPPFKQSRIGSSPLTRGTRTPVSTGSREPGFIPAYAGNSYANDLRSGIYSVHPRLRGELA